MSGEGGRRKARVRGLE